VWAKYSSAFLGLKIHSHVLFDFFSELEKPLGFGSDCSKLETAHVIARMNLYYDEGNHLYFHNVLYAAMRRALGDFGINKKTEAEKLMLKLITKEENSTKLTIKHHILKIQRKASGNYGNKRDEFLHAQVEKGNPFFSLMVMKRIITSWGKYAKAKR
jgi:hypothetical protein